jgi:hypothetical protein
MWKPRVLTSGLGIMVLIASLGLVGTVAAQQGTCAVSPIWGADGGLIGCMVTANGSGVSCNGSMVNAGGTVVDCPCPRANQKMSIEAEANSQVPRNWAEYTCNNTQQGHAVSLTCDSKALSTEGRCKRGPMNGPLWAQFPTLLVDCKAETATVQPFTPLFTVRTICKVQ